LQIPIGSQYGENWLYEYLRTVVRNLFLFNTNLILLFSYVVVSMFIYIFIYLYIFANTLRWDYVRHLGLDGRRLEFRNFNE